MTTLALRPTERRIAALVGCDADRRVATPRFTSCPIAVLCRAASPGYGLACTFRDDALHTRQVLCTTEVV